MLAILAQRVFDVLKDLQQAWSWSHVMPLLSQILWGLQLYIVCLGIPRLCDNSVKELMDTAHDSDAFDGQFSLFVEEMISLWTVFSESWALQILSTGGSLYQLVSVPREGLAYSLAVLTLEFSVICALVSSIYTRRLRRVHRLRGGAPRSWTKDLRASSTVPMSVVIGLPTVLVAWTVLLLLSTIFANMWVWSSQELPSSLSLPSAHTQVLGSYRASIGVTIVSIVVVSYVTFVTTSFLRLGRGDIEEGLPLADRGH